MIGTIIGDILGSPYEYKKEFDGENIKFKNKNQKFTDDTILTIAIMDSIINKIEYKENIIKYSLNFKERDYGYGSAFYEWMLSKDHKPYNSFGNGSAMRVSAIGYYFKTLDEVLEEAKKSAEVTHNHPEGIKGAQAIASAIFLAKNKFSKNDIKNFIQTNFEYDLNRKLKDIKEDYKFNAICQTTVPEAIIAFLDSKNYKSAIYNAISLRGDTDTLAAMAGGIAEAYYGINSIPSKFIKLMNKKIDKNFQKTILKFYSIS